MGRFSRSWEIAKASLRVLKSDKELVVIPLVGFLITIIVAVAFGVMSWLTVEETTVGLTTEYSPTPFTYVIGAAGYLLTTFTGIFFTSALVAGAHQRLTGGDPTIGSSIGAAFDKIGPIFLWSIVVTTVGLILQTIEERAGLIGRIVANLLGMAWRIVTWLAIPIIVVEGTGPFESLKKSGAMFKRTWGENLVGQVGFGLLTLLLVLPAVLLVGFVATVAPIAAIILGVAYFAAVALVLSALNGIYRAALYIYASTGEVAGGFPAEAMMSAFTPKVGAKRFLG